MINVIPQSQLRKMCYRCMSDANAGRFLDFSVTFIDRRLETSGHRWGHLNASFVNPPVIGRCQTHIFQYNYSTDYRPGIHRTSTGDRWSSTGESGIGRLSAGHLWDIGRCPVNARSGLVARLEDGDEMIESRSSRRFLIRPLTVRFRPIDYRPSISVKHRSITHRS
jgi:hypothetical protein